MVGDNRLVCTTFDQTHPDRPEGVLVCFVDAGPARRAVRMAADERRAAVIEDLVTYFGEQARQPGRGATRRSGSTTSGRADATSA